MKRVLLLAAAALLCLSAPASAVVYVEGTGEPAFTNTTTNTQWVKWQGSSSYDQYRLEFDFYAGSQLVKTEVRVADLAAQGLPAHVPRAAARHLGHAYAKLDIKGRSQLAAALSAA